MTRRDFKMTVIEGHKRPLNRQIHEGVELEMNAASIILNSKAEWNHSKIPRIIIEVGEDKEYDMNSGMVRSTELGGRERSNRRGMKIKKTEKREVETDEERNCGKRQKLAGEVWSSEQKSLTEGAGTKDRNGGWDKRKRRKSQQIKSAKEREKLETGSRLEEWLRAYGITRDTSKVKGAADHIERVRGAREKERGTMEKEKTEKVKWKTFEFTFRRTVTEEAREGVRRINELQEERKRKREDDFRDEVIKMMKKGEETQGGKEEELESLPTRENQCESENRKCIERETAEGNNRDGGESKRDVQEAHTRRETKEERKDTEERTGLVTPSKILQVGGPEGGEIRPKGGEGSDDQELAKGRGPMELNEKGVFSEPMPLSTGLTPRPKNSGERREVL